MDALRIRRFSAHYHLTPSGYQERERLDKVLRTVVDEALECALERAGVVAHEEICLRHLYVPVRLRLSRGDSALAMEWSMAIAHLIRRSLGEARPRHIVRYGSRTHAMIDLAFSVARGDYERAWAWTQMGIWEGGDSPSESEALFQLVRSLTAEPITIVPVLRALAGRATPAALFANIAGRMSPIQWIVCAKAALAAAEASPALLAHAEPGIVETQPQARRLLADSALIQRVVELVPLHDIDLRRALAALLILDAEPAALSASNRRAVALLTAMTDALHPAVVRTNAGGRSVDDPEAGDQQFSRTQGGISEEREPRRGDEYESTDRMTSPHLEPPEGQPEANEDPIPRVRQSGITSFGGLLFLLRVIQDLDLPKEMAENPALGGRSFRWVLHRVALSLVSTDLDDVAVLAFAGLQPNDASPSRGEDPPSERESEAIEAIVARIVSHLGRLLADERLTMSELLRFVCNRRAELVTDPGWIDIHLSVGDISTAIRRAGLDLDPGYLPWLGVVVRFIYE